VQRLGVDVGGTFTDLVLLDDESGKQFVHKVSSTPHDPSEAIVQGALELTELAGVAPAQVGLLFHGTTVATNMMIERNGANIGLITTAGFRDLLHIGRKKRPFNFSSFQDVPWQKYPLIRRRNRLTVTERIAGPNGEIVTDLDDVEVREAAERLKASGVEGVAVCFLFSFLNPVHERRAVEIVRDVFVDGFVSASHEVVPLYREYERFNTTAVNVYIGPKVSSYLRSLVSALADRGFVAPIRLMSSAGGVVTAAAATELPVSLLMSGPAAGLLAGIETGRTAGNTTVITLDVGGTSSDIGVAPQGQVKMKHLLDTKIQGNQVMVAMADIETIGAGGGSIASVSAEGVLEVGPRSAGADPGPACYGRGGTLPTTTDAAAALGWLRPKNFFGGRLPLDIEAARRAIEEYVSEPLELSIEEAALGIHTVVSRSMASTIVQLSVRRGLDPRDFDLIAQGGAGPLFACSVGAEVGAKRVIVPPLPGLASALGLLSTDMRYESAATVWQSSAAVQIAEVAQTHARLRAEARGRLLADGLNESEMEFETYADCRYPSQGYELRVTASDDAIDERWVATLVERFHDLHEATYRSRFDDREVQIINLRVVGVGKLATATEVGGGSCEPHVPHPADEIETCFRVTEVPTFCATKVYERTQLQPGATIVGPAIVEQTDTTTVIEPGFTAVVDGKLNLAIDMAGAGR
jgi:N-methylhydantoinase A